MTNDEHLHLIAEQTALQQMVDATPREDVIDRGSLIAQLQHVQRRLATEDIERQPARVRLTFSGRPVVASHGIFAEFGTEAVSGFTEAVVAMAASQVAPLAAKGRIPNRDQHQLLITNTALGSFGFELEEHSNETASIDEPSTVALAIERTQTLLHGTQGTDEDLADSAVAVDRRALDKIRAFLQTLADHGAVCAIETAGRRVAFTDVGQVRSSLARLSAENLVEHEETLTGELIGVLPAARTFEFQTDDQQIIRGQIAASIGDAHVLNELLRQPAAIRVLVTRFGRGRGRYALLDVSLAPADLIG